MKSVIAPLVFVLTITLLVSACSDVAPADPQTAAFDAWLTEARPIFANSGIGLESIVDDFQCQNREIGDGMLTEPACAGFRFLAADEKPISIQVDWSISNPERWHADMNLDSPLKVKCQEIQSSVEYQRAKNEMAEFVACRTQAGDEVLLAFSSANVIIAYLSAEFVQAYPSYVSGIFQTVETSP